ncbi:MAG: GNAT family N-acetyltransferase [Alphaproteobacteria bacterium]
MTPQRSKVFDQDASKSVALAENLNEGDLQDLCDATVDAIEAGGGFGWLSPPPRDTLERYWQGLMLIPDRRVFVARLDGLIAGSIQLHLNPRNNEAQAMLGRVTSAFVATWARGKGLGHMLIDAVEADAQTIGLRALTLDLRETQTNAIRTYESLGYTRWGTQPQYAFVDGSWIAGYHYAKELT